ncbi:class I SAM-dependent methyltransferase [Tropicimonas aquimaris]|uniref:Class I SAM-dependent methyltransferase n=1 Tax=Tropicimonas aquimaris TaxID=914152 RepID=A0ABW3IW06_9RHOB
MSDHAAIGIYEAHSEALRHRYDAVSAEDLFAPVADLLPPPPATVLDIGAGSGRDLAWFAARGHPVTAAEPVSAFRDAISARMPEAVCLAAQLPELEGVAGAFDIVLAVAVWHHLPPEARRAAYGRVAALLEPNGVLVLSLRHGAIHGGQPVYSLDLAEEIEMAEAAGLSLAREATAPSLQPENIAAGITWTWLALQKKGPGS